MTTAHDNYQTLSLAQQRDIKTACVIVTLGPIIKKTMPKVVSSIKTILKEEIDKYKTKENRTNEEEKYLKVLEETINLSEDLDGIKKLEALKDKTNFSASIPLVKKCRDTLPAILQFSGFAKLVQYNAISKFITFAMGRSYSGKGYNTPKGINEPFKGYDDIINSLMGHPLCKKKMEEEARAWENAHR